MNLKCYIFLSLVYFCNSFHAQTTLNQLDANGKPHGKWTVYLDKNWKSLSDSSKAVFYRYTYYDHGTNLYPMGPCGKNGWKLEAPESKLLNGEYKWYDAKGRLSSVHVLKNGEYVWCNEYFKTGGLSQHFDYTVKCAENPHCWQMTGYTKDGTVKYRTEMVKDTNGKWPVTRG